MYTIATILLSALLLFGVYMVLAMLVLYLFEERYSFLKGREWDARASMDRTSAKKYETAANKWRKKQEIVENIIFLYRP